MSGRPVRTASFAYALMAGVAVGLGAWWGRALPVRHPAPSWALGWWSSPVSIGLGLLVAGATIVFTRWALARTNWARALRRELRALVSGASARQLVVLGVCSGVAEELFFRGALQPIAGLTLTSIAFGLLHIGPRREFLPWTAWAVLMGFVLGGIYEATGALEGPILAHVLINTINLRVIALHHAAFGDARIDGGDGRLEPPKLVARVRRE